MEAEPTVFVVDDDAAMRKSIAFAVRSVGLNVEVYDSAEDFLAQWDANRPGCLVLDVRMPGMDGLHLQQALAGRAGSLPIVFVTGHGDVSMCAEAMKAGAVDFLEKPFEKENLLSCIGHALQIDQDARGERQRRSEVLERYRHLTERERGVMELLIAGKTTKEIASQLRISIKTVDNHRNNVLDKMGVSNLVELARLAVLYGLPPGLTQENS
jgi:FixJ family two-component response regulator